MDCPRCQQPFSERTGGEGAYRSSAFTVGCPVCRLRFRSNEELAALSDREPIAIRTSPMVRRAETIPFACPHCQTTMERLRLGWDELPEATIECCPYCANIVLDDAEEQRVLALYWAAAPLAKTGSIEPE